MNATALYLSNVVCLAALLPALGGCSTPETVSLRVVSPSLIEVEVSAPERLARLESGDLLSVHVATGATEDLPTVAGACSVEEGRLRFRPLFPFEPGVRYRAVLAPAVLAGSASSGDAPLTLEFGLPEPAAGPPTVVEHVYPSADLLPENQLKFYIAFSAPMGRGRAYDHVHLLDASGEEVAYPFLELGEELWDGSGTRLTVLFDPGRVKRELLPREEVGPPILEGGTYTLAIDAAWPDARGRPLGAPFRKTFRVGPPDYEQPDPAAWELSVPASGDRGALTVRFPEPLDHALLERVVWVEAEGGEIEGAVEVSGGEREWSFTPAAPWRPGPHRLVAQSTLEDLAGNSIGRPFEVDVFERLRERVDVKRVEREFVVR